MCPRGEMADALGLGPSERKLMGVQVPPRAETKNPPN